MQAPNLPPFSTHARQRGGKNNRPYHLRPTILSARAYMSSAHCQIIITAHKYIKEENLEGDRQREEAEREVIIYTELKVGGQKQGNVGRK